MRRSIPDRRQLAGYCDSIRWGLRQVSMNSPFYARSILCRNFLFEAWQWTIRCEIEWSNNHENFLKLRNATSVANSKCSSTATDSRSTQFCLLIVSVEKNDDMSRCTFLCALLVRTSYNYHYKALKLYCGFVQLILHFQLTVDLKTDTCRYHVLSNEKWGLGHVLQKVWAFKRVIYSSINIIWCFCYFCRIWTSKNGTHSFPWNQVVNACNGHFLRIQLWVRKIMNILFNFWQLY